MNLKLYNPSKLKPKKNEVTNKMAGTDIVEGLVEGGRIFLLAIAGGIGVVVAGKIIEFGANLILSFV